MRKRGITRHSGCFLTVVVNCVYSSSTTPESNTAGVGVFSHHLRRGVSALIASTLRMAWRLGRVAGSVASWHPLKTLLRRPASSLIESTFSTGSACLPYATTGAHVSTHIRSIAKCQTLGTAFLSIHAGAPFGKRTPGSRGRDFATDLQGGSREKRMDEDYDNNLVVTPKDSGSLRHPLCY